MIVKHEARILIVDDEKDLREVLRDLLRVHFSDVEIAGSYTEAIQALESKDFDVLVCDYKINGKTGLEVRKWQLTNKPDIQFILLTGYADDPGIIKHLERDHFQVLQKPAHANELILPLKRDFPKKAA